MQGKKRRHGAKRVLGSVQTSESIMRILESSLDNADEEKQTLETELSNIGTHAGTLREIIYKPYNGLEGEEIPSEFGDSQKFLSAWDNLDRALGNTILMVMPPQLFQLIPQNQEEKTEKSSQPIIIMNKEQPTPQVARQPTKGFFSGFHDVRIAKLELQSKQQQDETPTITTDKVTYDPKAIVYQLIPSLNQIKERFFWFLHRHLSYRTPSISLLKHAHQVLQEEMSKYFDVVNPFCYASITNQKEKLRAIVLQQIMSLSRIAQAEAIARAYQQPFIPNEVRAMMRAMQEGKPYDSKGFSIPSSDEIASRKRRRE